MKILKIVITSISILLLCSCIVPKPPKRIFYKLNNHNIYKKNDSYGNVYNISGYYMNLWIFSTYWKNIYFSTNAPIKDNTIKINMDNKIFYLKKMSKKDIELLPYKLFYNDSVKVYEIEIDNKRIINDDFIIVDANGEFVFEKE